jgi:glycosyltransferase involved in cell wall biosynthesis
MLRVAVVLGTYNRFDILRRLVNSVRERSGTAQDFIIVDGGSTDGSREWLAAQSDVILIGQRGDLTGAVRAFNLGFGYAVDHAYDMIVHLNDDAELVTDGAFAAAAEILECDPSVGEVAFEFDLRGPYGFDSLNGGNIYANYGMIRRQAGMEVARRQGDPSGRKFWNSIYRTYGADSEFGCQLLRLGWKVYPGVGLRIHDLNTKDELRRSNTAKVANTSHTHDTLDAATFWGRWRDAILQPDPHGCGPVVSEHSEARP